MTTSNSYTIWVNDQLDLLNYAKQLGDQDWQDNILHRLKEVDQASFDSVQVNPQASLWNQYEAIIQEMVALYDQVRSSRDSLKEHQIKERIWELKQQRVQVAKLIKSLNSH